MINCIFSYLICDHKIWIFSEGPNNHVIPTSLYQKKKKPQQLCFINQLFANTNKVYSFCS